MRLTVDQVMSYGPCYNLDKVEALFAGRETITLHDVAAMDIPKVDKVWLFRQENVLSSGTKVKWLEIIVTRAIKTALTVYTEPSYVKWAENWLNGTDRSFNSAHAAENNAAAYAACGLARATSRAAAAAYAAHAAANVAAATVVTVAAAAVAVYATATVATVATVAAAEYKQQVADLMTLLDKEMLAQHLYVFGYSGNLPNLWPCPN